MFGMVTLRVAKSAIASALAVHNGASPIFQHHSAVSNTTKSLELGLSGCPFPEGKGGQTGLLPLYAPFDAPIS